MERKADIRKDPMEYMKLAVEIMKKSILERKKKDPSPYVGAVLVFPDGIVETAYRGEFREGDHAEYTLLDKKNRDRELTGCWLFVTLEPCAPGARNAPKVSCAERIVNARISDVWFGIEDKNPKVDHGGIDHMVETFDDALVLIPDKVEGWLTKVLPASIDRSKFKAQQVPSFPVEVIREAVINAIAHRDYALDGAKVQLDVYPDRIVVKSPGEPVPPITIEALKKFTASSYSRNKKIAFIFNEMEYMEESAVGMDTFRSLHDKYNLPLPIFEHDGINITIAFPRTIEAVKEVSSNKAIGFLTEAQLLGYEWLIFKGEASTREYSSNFNIGYKTAQRHLAKMRELGLIGDNGEDTNSPNYKYVVI